MEASEAMCKVVVHMSECQLDDETRMGLRYQETLFESVNLRLASLEKRMQNVIDLVSTDVSRPTPLLLLLLYFTGISDF
jgi:hypothetical protein